MYSNNKFDLAGFSVGIASKAKLLGKHKVQNNDIVLAIPSNGIHSNGYSLVRSVIKKISIKKKLKNILLRPTKIYVKEVLKLTSKNLINSAAHITGGGLIENLLRSIPSNLTLNIDLSKIKTGEIFRWLKRQNISDAEMMKTFNCGVGFCLIVNKKNVNRVKKFFPKKFRPYEIGFISKKRFRVKLFNDLKW